MYRVIHRFKDLEDVNEHVYEVNDKFPYDSREIEDSRISDLTTSNNKIGCPLIKYEEDKTGENNPGEDSEDKTKENNPNQDSENNSALGGEEMTLDLTDLKQPKLKEIAKKLEISFKSIISNDELKKLIEEKRAAINSIKE